MVDRKGGGTGGIILAEYRFFCGALLQKRPIILGRDAGKERESEQVRSERASERASEERRKKIGGERACQRASELLERYGVATISSSLKL